MGKVTVSEPSKGEALTVTKINETIASWTTEASNIDDENVHDQSLDHYNFRENAVRSQNEIISRGSSLIRFANHKGINQRQIKVYASATTLDFTNHKHIFRGSYHIWAFPHYPTTSEINDFKIVTKVFVSHGNFTPIQVPGSERIIRYEGDQLQRISLDETISYSCLLNNVTALQLTGTVSNLQVFLQVLFEHFSADSGDNVKMGVYGHFSEVETIKR